MRIRDLFRSWEESQERWNEEHDEEPTTHELTFIGGLVVVIGLVFLFL
jgi:hypothetical protein